MSEIDLAVRLVSACEGHYLVAGIGRFKSGARKVEPWPDIVNGETLLDELTESFARHVVLTEHALEWWIII